MSYPTRTEGLVNMRLDVSGRIIVFFVGCCFQELFIIARSILVQFPFYFFSMHLLRVAVVHLYCSTDTTTVREKPQDNVTNFCLMYFSGRYARGFLPPITIVVKLLKSSYNYISGKFNWSICVVYVRTEWL